MNNPPEIHKVRPSGRHLLTIGKDLIHDQYAAIVELVKNSYDADASEVSIDFFSERPHSPLQIVINDNGHGMDKDTIVNKWLVPSTDDKLKRKKSPQGRVMQGRKGVGRYAASILGQDLLLETISRDGVKTTVYIEWDEFSRKAYLDEVDVLLEYELTDEKPRTTLTIKERDCANWNQQKIIKLEKELKKLISPVDETLGDNAELESFSVTLGCDMHLDLIPFKLNKKIEPYPIFELFDYAIEGRISSNGKGEIRYINQKGTEVSADNYEDFDKLTLKKNIDFELGKDTGCGSIAFKIHVYDRDQDSIAGLISRGLKDDHGSYLGKREASKMLNDFNGIGVYRNGFRIRPLGDPTNDWLELNKKRVQSPAKKIGGDQVIGYVLIESEESSGLEEKSARDGLRDNNAFDNLIETLNEVIGILERYRYIFRRTVGLGRKPATIDEHLIEFTEAKSLEQKIENTLEEYNANAELANSILNLIKQEEQTKESSASKIKELIAKYQGQVTLGQILDIVLHEGGGMLNTFVNSLASIPDYIDLYLQHGNSKYFDKIKQKIEGLQKGAEHMADLFEKLDPLATRKRGTPSELSIIRDIERVQDLLDTKLQNEGIQLEIIGNPQVKLVGWSVDIFAIFLNLINNSRHWMARNGSKEKLIKIEVESEGSSLLCINYTDTGPGIESELIQSGVIFDLGYSEKDNGAGLGLTISGEAAKRFGLGLYAIEHHEGAFFKLEPTTEDDNE